MNWKHIPVRVFLKLYKNTSLKNRKRIIPLLDNLRLLPFSVKQHIDYRGEFKVEVSPRSSFRMINFGGFIENQTFKSGLFKTWERDVGWIWKELCRISPVIFDIGANTGIYSLTAKAINKEAKIFAFEPAPHFYEQLIGNNKLNDTDINCEQLAISNETGIKVFYDVPNKKATAASLSPEKLKEASWYKGKVIEYQVEAMKLSDYIQKKLIQQIDLLKLDIEMHETEALEGMGSYLDKFKPVILIEVLSIQMAEKLNTFLKLEDYKIFHLKASSKAELVLEFKMFPDANINHEWNFLVFHKSIEQKIKERTSLYRNLL